jgi:hypothetical protein
MEQEQEFSHDVCHLVQSTGLKLYNLDWVGLNLNGSKVVHVLPNTVSPRG